ncbi:MAG: (2Fe-2S)-binding protein [Candidatus Omnitrophica bacterium]|nr:(2Fe-2S)-binding protein [Candidatus Omnitrophota bacterium]
MPKIHFTNKNRVVEADRGESILDAALRHNVSIYHTCGGNASCSTCRVVVLKGERNLSPIETAEAEILDAFDLKPPHRLGCQALIIGGEIEIEIPDHARAPRPNKTPQLPGSDPCG